MISHVLKLLICAFSVAVALTAGAEAAQKTKKSRPAAPQMTAGNVDCRGPNVFRCGPLYSGPDYLGTDPDPFIRTMIDRDLGAKYGPPD